MDSGSDPMDRTAGMIVLRPARHPDSVPYFLYRPANLRRDAQPLVSVHGISRNAMEHMEAFAPIAEATGRPLLAPLYTLADNRRYQLAVHKAERSDQALLMALSDFGIDSGHPVGKIDLFGFSGGAQFAHRFAMLHPDRVERLALSSSGWFTFPTTEDRYPYGLGGRSPAGPQIRSTLDRFHRIPILVLVGERDITRDPGLRQKPIVDERQGRNRVERARRWAAAVTGSAKAAGIQANVCVETLPDCGHSFADCVARGGLARKVGRWFGAAA